MKRYEGKNIRIATYKRGGYFILRISTYGAYFVASRRGRKPQSDSGWTQEYEKKFEDKESANRYFKGIKRGHPDLKKIFDDPDKYIDHEGKVREYPKYEG